jgi:hypothetical protein
MKCRSCGTEIAANALICYKCGTATTEPKIQPPAARPRRSSRGLIAGVVAVGLVVAAYLSQQAGCLSLL